MSSANRSDPQAASPSHPARQDARDLMALLYREIGISAVAAALQVDVEIARRVAAMPEARPLPSVLRGDDIAA